MKVTIDQEGCTECGACVDECPDVFEMKSGEKAGILSKYRTGSSAEGEIGEDLSDCTQKGALVCPVAVINVS